MRSFAPAKADLDLYLVALLQEPPRRAHANLQIVIVSTRSQADLFHLRHMLVLLRITRALVLFKPEASQVGNATHRWVGRSSHFDQVKPGFLRPAQGLVNRNDSKLFAALVDDTDLRDADLEVGTRPAWYGWTCIKWSTGYGKVPLYFFFFGPLLTMGGFGATLAPAARLADPRQVRAE